MILNVAACFSFEECFVSLSWLLCKPFLYCSKMAIMSQTQEYFLVFCHISVETGPLHLKHKIWLRSSYKLGEILRFSMDRYLTERISYRYKLNTNTSKVNLNVGACFSWVDWFVSLSWFKNTDKVTIASVNLFCFSQKRAIRSVLTNLKITIIWSKCKRGFLTDLNWRFIA